MAGDSLPVAVKLHQPLGDDQVLAVIGPGEARGGHDTQPWRARPVAEPDRGNAIGAHPLGAGSDVSGGDGRELGFQRRQLEQARYAATKAERRYRSVDPENRLVARGLETEWETALGQLADAGAELARREQARPKTLTAAERAAILSLGDNLEQVWTAPTTTDKDRKQLLRTLLEEVTVNVHRDDTEGRADLLLRWKGGAISELAVPIRRQPPKIRTDEDTIDLIRRLAVHYPDAQIAGILNRQHRRKGLSYTPARVQTLRFRNDIPGRRPSRDPQEGELLTVAETARELGLVPSTVHRWLNDGFIHGEQLTPGAPWRIRLTGDIRALLVDNTPDGWLATLEATHAYGLSRQTLLQRVKRGEIRAVYLRTGRKKGLRIAPPAQQAGLF